MIPRTRKPVVRVFPAQGRGIEDAVLTLLGEQELEPDEITETDATPTKHHLPKRPGPVAVIRFEPRRSGGELPWDALTGGLQGR